jgi:hypothetical protein
MTGPYLPPEDASEAAAMVEEGSNADSTAACSLPSETCAGGCVAQGGKCVTYGFDCVGLRQICGFLYCCLPVRPIMCGCPSGAPSGGASSGSATSGSASGTMVGSGAASGSANNLGAFDSSTGAGED